MKFSLTNSRTLLIAAASLALIGTAAAQDPIRIGLQAPLTGPWAVEGEMAQNSVQVVVDKINADGGVLGRQIEIVLGDDQGEPRQSALVAQRFVTQGVDAAIASYGSSVTEPAQLIYEDAGMLNIAYGATAVSLTSHGYEYFFRPTSRDDSEGAFFAEFATQTLGADRIALQIMGRLHGNETHELEQMVLHHVAQGPCPVVIPCPLACPQRLGHRDLDMVNAGRVPDRLQQHVGKAQDQQVLDRLLAEIVVDTEDRALVEHRAHGLVNGAGRVEIMPDGLFQHDARARRHQPVPVNRRAYRSVNRRRQRQIEHAYAGGITAELFAQGFPALTLPVRVGTHIGHKLAERVPTGLALGACVLAVHRLERAGQKLRRPHLLARRCNDA